MRHFIRGAAVAACAASNLAIIAAPASADQVIMPYQCKVERGRVLLSPANERGYEIIGSRRQQPFLFCIDGQSDRCRLRMLHRFEIVCGTARVPWATVAAAAARHAGRDAWIEGGQLHVAQGFGSPGQYAGAGAGCVDAPWSRGPSRAPSPIGGYDKPCHGRPPHVVAFPPGLAPLNEVGARLVLAQTKPSPPPAPISVAASQALATAPSAPPAIATAQAPTPLIAPPPPVVLNEAPAPNAPASIDFLPSSLQVAAAPIPPEWSAGPASAIPVAVPMPFRTPLQQPAAQPLPVTSSQPEPVAARQQIAATPPWIVTVSPDNEEITAAIYSGGASGVRVWIIAAFALSTAMAALAWALRQGRIPVAHRTSGSLARTRIQLPLDPEARALEDLRNAAVQLRSNAETMLEHLRQAPALRGVLRQELDLIVQRMSDPGAPNAEPPTPRQRRQRLQAGIRELHRVIKITEGATASFSSGAPRPTLPTTRDEAYALLGVNDSVSEPTLKKLIDALRMSWHPDHARDDADRVLREERIKQINVAWELVTSKRAAG